MTQLRTSMVIDLTGNLASRASQFLGSMQRLGTGGSRSMQLFQRSVHAAGQGLDRLGNRYTALLTGAAGVGTMKQVGDISERLNYVARMARISRGEIDQLYNSIMDVAQAPDIRVDPSEILAGVETIIEKIGDLDLARENLKNIGYTIRATGAAGKDAGDMIANFRQKFDIKSPTEMLRALDTLVVQGKAGAFSLRDMVTQGNRVTSAIGSWGRKGLPAVREMGAVLQVFRQSAGTAEETSTAFKNFFADLMEGPHKKILEANGIKLWDPNALKEGKKQIRPILELIDEILRKSNGDPEKLSKLFGMQTMDGFKAFINTWQSGGKNAAVEFNKVQGDGKELMADSASMAREFNAAVRNLHTTWQRFAAANFTKPVQATADALNSVEPGTLQRWLKVGTYGAGVVGTVVAGRKIYNYGARARRFLTGKGEGLGGALGDLAASGRPIPVYVVNQPGGLGGAGGSIGSLTGGAAAGGSVGSLTGSLPKAPSALVAFGTPTLPLATALLARPVGKYLAEREARTSSTRRLQDLLSQQMVMGGGPRSFQAQTIAEELKRRGALNVNGAITIEIKSAAPAKVTSVKSHGIDLNVDAGLMMMTP